MFEASRSPRGARRRAARLRQPRLRRVRSGGTGPLSRGAAFRVLGVDPGSFRTGWALLTGRADRPEVLECGEIVLDPKAAFPVRLSRLHEAFGALVERLEPSSAAVESPFHGASARAALQLAHARGVLLAVLAGRGVPVSDYPPATVKKAVTGNGRAEKSQVQAMVQRLVGPTIVVDRADIADAIAIALCDLAHSRFDRAVRTDRRAVRRTPR